MQNGGDRLLTGKHGEGRGSSPAAVAFQPNKLLSLCPAAHQMVAPTALAACPQVAQVAWRLAAATKCSLEANKQAAEEELRRALEDSEGEERLLAQVQAADVIEEAQVGSMAGGMQGPLG